MAVKEMAECSGCHRTYWRYLGSSATCGSCSDLVLVVTKRTTQWWMVTWAFWFGLGLGIGVTLLLTQGRQTINVEKTSDE